MYLYKHIAYIITSKWTLEKNVTFVLIKFLEIFTKSFERKLKLTYIYIYIYMCIYICIYKNLFFIFSYVRLWNIPLHKALFSFVLRWKLKKLLKIECARKAFVKLLAVTDRNAASSGAAAHNHTSRKPDQHWAVVSVSSLTDRCFSPNCLELVCLWKACVHILPTWLGDWEILQWKGEL